MKRIYFFVLVLFVAGISTVTGQTNQRLTQGQIFTGNITPGAVHTYTIRLGNDSEYFIAWDDWDTNDDFVDVIVGVRGDQWGQYLINVQDSGNFGLNVHRLVNQNAANTKKNPLNFQRHELDSRGQEEFVPGNEYIFEVRGYDGSASGAYRVVFY